MNVPLFLYKFVKVYVPGAVALMIIYTFTHYDFRSVFKVLQPNTTPVISKPQQVVPPVNISVPQPKITPRAESISPKPKEAVKQRYIYLVELASGGSMKATAYKVNGNVVKLFITDGYEITLGKSDITGIKKIKL